MQIFFLDSHTHTHTHKHTNTNKVGQGCGHSLQHLKVVSVLPLQDWRFRGGLVGHRDGTFCVSVCVLNHLHHVGQVMWKILKFLTKQISLFWLGEKCFVFREEKSMFSANCVGWV